MKIFICFNKDLLKSENFQIKKIKVPSKETYIKDLKKIINDRFNISENQQKLTFKLINTYVTLTNDFPLSFYFIRNNSKIFLQKINPVEEKIEIKMEKYNQIKFKYYQHLNFYYQINKNKINILNKKLSDNENFKNQYNKSKNNNRKIIINNSQNNFNNKLYNNNKSNNNILKNQIENEIKNNIEYKEKQTKIQKYNFLNILPKIETYPPILLGKVEKTGRMLPIYRYRIIELNPYLGYIKRYKSHLDYPNNPNEIIPLLEIKKCKIVNSKNSDHEFFFDIDYIEIERYKVYSKSSCEQWVYGINKSIEFYKYFKMLEKNFNNVNLYLKEYKPKIIQISFDKDNFKNINLDTLTYYNKLNIKENNNNKVNLNEENKNNFFANTASTNKNNIYKKQVFLKDFEIIKIIGNGTFGKVFQVKCKLDNKIYAMKVLKKKSLIENNQLKYAISEKNILKKLDHPFIIKLHFSFQTPLNLYMILDYCQGGDLNYHLQKKTFSEKEIKFYISELILSIEYLHNKNIIYRDLKPENILIYNDNHIKLCDFGLAKENNNINYRNKTFCGSSYYLSPEMIEKKGINYKSDIYQIGIIIYELFYGFPPFDGKNYKELINNILLNKVSFNKNIFISENLKHLILGILNKNENERFNIIDIKKHNFFSDVNWNDVFNKKNTLLKDLVEQKTMDDEFIKKNNIIFNDEEYNNNNINLNRIFGFTYVNEDFEEEK